MSFSSLEPSFGVFGEGSCLPAKRSQDMDTKKSSRGEDRLTTTSSFSSLGSCQRSLFLFYERLKARDPGYVHFFVFLDLNRFLSLFFSFFISFIHSTAIFLLEAVDEKK